MTDQAIKIAKSIIAAVEATNAAYCAEENEKELCNNREEMNEIINMVCKECSNMQIDDFGCLWTKIEAKKFPQKLVGVA